MQYFIPISTYLKKLMTLVTTMLSMALLTNTVSAQTEEIHANDSLRMLELSVKLEELRLNEMLLKAKLDEHNHHNEDSIKRAHRQHQIDSLRAVTPGVPLVVEEDTLFTIFSAHGGYSAVDRVENTAASILKISDSTSLKRDSIYLLDNETYIDIMYGDKVVMSVTEQDAMWHGTTVRSLAEQRSTILANKIEELKDEHSFWQLVKRLILFATVIFVQCLVVKFINYMFRRLRRRIVRVTHQKMKPFIVHNYELLNVSHLCRILLLISKIVRYAVLLLLFVLTIPILFSIFPQTEKLAYQIFSYIWDPIKMVAMAVLEYIPNIFIIVIIWLCIRYIIKGVRYISDEIKNEKLKISGFYPDWAEPTFNIIRFLLYLFMIAMVYPYLPGSKSGVFQGISVFVGIIVSLGSSTVITNFIAGFVITYMRPFKKGDFVKVNDTVGNVIEKSPFVTRVRTIKNELVTIPNSFIISSNTINYTVSAQTDGLIIHTVLTMGYDVPWRKVHELLIDAAIATEGVVEHPAPFVLETELNDNYMCYQINAYIKNADDMPVIMSRLLENIQDYFNEAGIELFAPHHFTTRQHTPSPKPPVNVQASPLSNVIPGLPK